MRRRYLKLATAFLITITLVATCVPSHAGLSATPKDETIYAVLDQSGKAVSVNVVNAFETANISEIDDYGSYVQIKNLSNSSKPTLEEDLIKWAEIGDGQVFYYQGTLEDTALPWNFSFNYCIDGKVVDPSELAGRDGHLEMKFSIVRNSAFPPFFSDNMMLQLTMTLDCERCSNIVAPDATIVTAGSSKTLSFMILPKTSSSTFVVESDVIDFEMDSMTVNASAVNLSLESYTVPITDGFEQLSDGLDEMISGTKQLESGAGQLYEGVSDVDSAVTEISSGAKELSDASRQVMDGLNQLSESGGALSDGYRELESNLSQASAGMGQLEAMAGNVAKSQDAEARQLAMVVLAMLKGLDQASQGLSLLNSNLNQYVAAVSDISAKYYDFDDGLHSMSDGLTELNRGTSSIRSEVKELPSQIGLLAKGQEEMKNGVESAVQKVNDMAGGNSTSVKPVSFVSPEKSNVRSVQFVLRTLEIKKRSDEIETAVVDERQESFWDRFLNLFNRQ